MQRRISTLSLAAIALTAALPAVADVSSHDPAALLEQTTTVTFGVAPMISVDDFKPTAIANAAQPPSREAVREEFRVARAHGMLSRAGEAGDTQDVLLARNQYNDAQVAQITAEYQTELDRRVALAVDAQRQQALAEQTEQMFYP